MKKFPFSKVEYLTQDDFFFCKTPTSATPAPTLVSVTVTGADTIDEGDTSNYTATALYSDASTLDVTTLATWSHTGPISSVVEGVATAELVTEDTAATVTATYEETPGTKNLTVLNVPIFNVDGTSTWVDTVSSAAGSVARAMTATYTNAAGSIVEVGVNEARPSPAGLVIETESTNLVVDSDNLGAATWTPSRVTVSGTTAAPMAGELADGLISDTDTNVHYLISSPSPFAVTPGETLWFSGFAKAGSQASQAMAVLFIGGSGAFSAVYAQWASGVFQASGDWYPAGNDIESHSEAALAGGWYRYAASVVVPAGSLVAALTILPGGAGPYAGDGLTQDAWFWGAQVERADALGTLIRTAGASVTRPEDVYTMPTPDAVESALAAAGTLVLKASFARDLSASTIADGEDLTLFASRDSEVTVLRITNTGGTIYATSVAGSGGAFVALPAMVAGTDYWFSVEWAVGGTIRVGYSTDGASYTWGDTDDMGAAFVSDATLRLVREPLFGVNVELINIP